MSEEPGEYNVERKRRLNGWQRLWVIFSVPWLVFVIARMLKWLVVKGHDLNRGNGTTIVLSLIAPIGIYILVLVARRTILWVIEGFRDV